MELFNIKALSFRYPEAKEPALNNISFDINAGEFVVLCGKSGCGKTTLLRLMKKELAPSGDRIGDIHFRGAPIDSQSSQPIGFVLQNPDNQIVTDRVFRELSFGLESYGTPQNEMRLRVCEMASYFGIEDWFYKDIHKLSGGQKQLLNLAAVMATSPDVLILDEPTAQLDPITAGNFISTLKKLNNDLGTTIIIAEHRLEELFPLADRVLAMNQGQITFNGSARKLCTLADDSVKESLPCAARIFLSLSARGECPLTVNEGRQFLNNFNFDPQYGKKHIVSKPVGKKLLELKEVFFRYERNSQDILKGLSLTAWENETLCILGANGTGKTTLLKVAAGILKPRLGKVIRCQDGEVALLPQNSSDILIKDTILEDFECVCQAAGYSRKNSEERIHTVSEKLFITNLMKRHPLDLSGGEQQRCAIARLLLAEPRIILLDEPTKGTDPASKEHLIKILSELKKENISIIVVTHDMEFAAAAADRCCLIFGGEKVCESPPHEFFSKNYFYTTSASRISRGILDGCITCDDITEACLAAKGTLCQGNIST